MIDPAIIAAAGAIIDIWMGGDKTWRSRINESDFLESYDWLNAVELATAALSAASRVKGHGDDDE